MKKYLVVIVQDVADEGDVGLIQVITEKELSKIRSFYAGFGNIEGESYPISEAEIQEITEEEIKVLQKFGLNHIIFGSCCLSKNAVEHNDDFDEEE
jgi:hypothetical protein